MLGKIQSEEMKDSPWEAEISALYSLSLRCFHGAKLNWSQAGTQHNWLVSSNKSKGA
jgi:hypothetical protein